MNALPTIRIAIADKQTLLMQSLIKSVDELKVVISARNGKELLDKIAGAALQPDICILDIDMPVMDGYETMSLLHQKYPFIRVIVLTDNDCDFSILKMLQNGVSGYILKDIDLLTFQEAVISVYTKGYYYSSNILERFPKLSANKIDTYLKRLLTEQEVTFMSLCIVCTYREIAKAMNLSERTIQHMAERIKGKLKLRSKAKLVMYSLKAGIGKT